MSLLMKVTDDMKTALKAKDSTTLSTLRFLISAAKNKKIDLQHELSDEEMQDVIKTQVKQLKDSIVSFEAGGRADLVGGAKTEIEILSRYLPEQMTDGALEALVRDVVAQTGAKSKSEMGKVMGMCVKVVQGKADGARIKEIVSRILPIVVLIAVFGCAQTVSAASLPSIPREDMIRCAGMLETSLRILRVLVLWFGIGAIMLIINGAFQFMTASFRDDEHTQAMGKITQGIFITVLIAAIFAVSTIYLQRLG